MANYLMKKALKKHNKPFEWYVEDNEAHGFRDEKNRKKLFTKIIKFLDEHTAPKKQLNSKSVALKE